MISISYFTNCRSGSFIKLAAAICVVVFLFAQFAFGGTDKTSISSVIATKKYLLIVDNNLQIYSKLNPLSTSEGVAIIDSLGIEKIDLVNEGKKYTYINGVCSRSRESVCWVASVADLDTFNISAGIFEINLQTHKSKFLTEGLFTYVGEGNEGRLVAIKVDTKTGVRKLVDIQTATSQETTIQIQLNSDSQIFEMKAAGWNKSEFVTAIISEKYSKLQVYAGGKEYEIKLAENSWIGRQTNYSDEFFVYQKTILGDSFAAKTFLEWTILSFDGEKFFFGYFK